MRLHLSVPPKVYDDGITPSHNQLGVDKWPEQQNTELHFPDPASYRHPGLILVGIADHYAGCQSFTAVLPI
jgi:hypothetical protein